MFTISLGLWAEVGNRKVRVIARRVDLPFVPVNGLTLDLEYETPEQDEISYTIDMLSYDIEDGLFHSAAPCHPEDIEMYIRNGWIEQIQQRGIPPAKPKRSPKPKR